VSEKKPIIGLCGGIGAGKSRVAAEFARQGCQVVDSDQLNHEVLGLPAVVAMLRSWWGEGVVDASGRADARRIAEIVFADPAEKRRLEQLVYPLIAQRRAAIITQAKDNSAIKAIVLDSPLLLESNLDRECDSIVYVATSAARRLERLRQSRGWDAKELHRRERWQISPVEKQARAGFVVHNGGPPEQLGPQVSTILATILARHSPAE
jgi:dephospho-CoA kinase